MSFDILAPHYRWMEFLLAGGKLQRCRTAFLHRLTCPKNALIAGEGNGRFLVEFRRRFPSTAITVVDSSARMLNAARHRLHRRGFGVDGIEFVHRNILTWGGRVGHFDLIVTHFFLDCFPPEELQHVVATLAGGAAPDARWLVADFQMADRGLRKLRSEWIHASMYAFFRLATRLPARCWTEPDRFLGACNFRLMERTTSEWDLLRSDLWVSN